MTVQELIEELKLLDPSVLIAIDTRGFGRGLYPASDMVSDDETAIIEHQSYECVVLMPTEWP
jgi:hypothetical protein